MEKKKLLYCDMDGVICDFSHGIYQLDPNLYLGDDGSDYEERSKKVDELCMNNIEIFHNLRPMPGAIEAVKALMAHYDVYFLSTPMYAVPNSYAGKRIWLEKYFGETAKKKLILTHRKDLNIGDFLIDDRKHNGAGEFTGEHIHYGTEKFPNWNVVLKYLLPHKEYHSANLNFFINENVNIKIKSTIPKKNELLNIDFTNSEDVKHFYNPADGVISLILNFLDDNGLELHQGKYLVQGKVSTVTHAKYLLNSVSIKPINIYLLK